MRKEERTKGGIRVTGRNLYKATQLGLARRQVGAFRSLRADLRDSSHRLRIYLRILLASRPSDRYAHHLRRAARSRSHEIVIRPSTMRRTTATVDVLPNVGTGKETWKKKKRERRRNKSTISMIIEQRSADFVAAEDRSG